MVKILRSAMIGKYEIEASLSGLLAESIVYSIEYLKKRRIRTLLVSLTVGAVTYAMLTLASVTTAPVLVPFVVNGTANFEGVNVRTSPWRPLNILVYDAYRSYYGRGNVTARAYFYPPPPLRTIVAPAGGVLYFALTPKCITPLYSLMVVTPEDGKLLGLEKYIIKGRFFNDNDLFAVILPQSIIFNLTKELGKLIDVNSSLNFLGLELKIIGIINDTFDQLRNPDGERITPFDMSSPLEAPYHIRSSFTILIPYKLFEKLSFPPSIAAVTISSSIGK